MVDTANKGKRGVEDKEGESNSGFVDEDRPQKEWEGEVLQEMLMGGRMEAGKDRVGIMRLITGGNMMIEGGAKNSFPPQRPQRKRLGK